MPLGYNSRRQRHGVQKLLFLLVAVLMLVMITDVHATTSRFDVASTVRADSNVNDGSSSKATTTGSSSNAELRSLNFQDVLKNVWDLRTLQPKSSSTVNEAADEANASGDSISSDSKTTSTTAAPINAESLSLSADDAVTEALKTATPTVTPAPVVTAIVTQTPVPTATLVVTSTPVVTATPTPVPSPVQTPAPTPSPSPTASDDENETAAESSTHESGLDTDELAKNVSIKSGSSNSSFDETIVVMILGGVGLIGVVVLVMSRKISKETGDDEAIRRASSFGIARL